MPDPSKLQVGDKIRIIHLPEMDRIQYEQTGDNFTIRFLQRIIDSQKTMTIARLDEYSQPWFDYTFINDDGEEEDHTLAIMEDESWEFVEADVNGLILEGFSAFFKAMQTNCSVSMMGLSINGITPSQLQGMYVCRMEDDRLSGLIQEMWLISKDLTVLPVDPQDTEYTSRSDDNGCFTDEVFAAYPRGKFAVIGTEVCYAVTYNHGVYTKAWGMFTEAGDLAPINQEFASMETVSLFRPTGQKELDLVAESGFKKWPPRLPEQPIFYPVTNEQYATEIAEKWNTKDKDSGNVGYVTRFKVKRIFIEKYDVQTVGAAHHTEYWIPAEDIDAFNDSIIGEIEVLHKFEGDAK